MAWDLCNQFGSGLRPSPPKSNLQRQREFVARHPNYYRDRRRKEKARINAAIAAQQAAAEALRLEAQAPLFIEHVRQDLQEQLGLPAPAQQLALPAPTPALTIQISLFTELQPEPLPVSTGSRNSTHA